MTVVVALLICAVAEADETLIPLEAVQGSDLIASVEVVGYHVVKDPEDGAQDTVVRLRVVDAWQGARPAGRVDLHLPGSRGTGHLGNADYIDVNVYPPVGAEMIVWGRFIVTDQGSWFMSGSRGLVRRFVDASGADVAVNLEGFAYAVSTPVVGYRHVAVDQATLRVATLSGVLDPRPTDALSWTEFTQRARAEMPAGEPDR